MPKNVPEDDIAYDSAEDEELMAEPPVKSNKLNAKVLIFHNIITVQTLGRVYGSFMYCKNDLFL